MKAVKIIIGALICAIILLHTENAYASNEINIEVDGDIYAWPDDDANGKVEKTEDGIAHITYDATTSEDAYGFYYISSMFKNAYVEDVFKDKYKVIAFDITNNSDVVVNINVYLVDSDNDKVVLSKDAYIFKEIGENTFSEKSYGNIMLEAGFSGRIYIPVKFLVEDETNEASFEYQKLAAWGMSFFVDGKNKIDTSINKLMWFDDEYMNKYEHSFGVYIEGMDNIQFPEHGEAIYFYDVVSELGSDKMTYQFVLDGFDKGIKMDSNGKLTLDTSCETKEIIIKAIDENGICIFKKVSVEKLWRVDNEELKFNGPDDLDKIEYPFDFVTSDHIDVLRMILIISAVVVFSAYIVFYTKHKLDKRKEEME